MMIRSPWTRRSFLGTVAAIPVLGAGCESSEAPDGDPPTVGGSGGNGGADGTGNGAGGAVGEGGAGGVSPPEHTCSKRYPRIDLKADCGAAGDGVSNDTHALQKAVELLSVEGGGELTIPPGVYIVGDQTEGGEGSSGAYYEPIPMFKAQGLTC